MKLFFHKLGSFALAIVVLFSTMSFTIDKHYCGSMLVDIAINAKAKTCGMEMSQSKDDSCVSKKSCCENEHIVIIGQDELKKNFDTSIELPVSVGIWEAPRAYTFFLQKQTLFIPLGNHDPPDIVSNFQQLYETYLI